MTTTQRTGQSNKEDEARKSKKEEDRELSEELDEFTIASLFSGLAPGPDWLIAARLAQGAMAALMVPQVMSLMQIMYKPEERGAINGLFGALGGLAASLGPVVGGLLIKANLFGWDWRPIFLINVPVGIFAILAAIKYLPDGKSPHPLHLDITGTFLQHGCGSEASSLREPWRMRRLRSLISKPSARCSRRHARQRLRSRHRGSDRALHGRSRVRGPSRR